MRARRVDFSSDERRVKKILKSLKSLLLELEELIIALLELEEHVVGASTLYGENLRNLM